jgi:hypothetical protein
MPKKKKVIGSTTRGNSGLKKITQYGRSSIVIVDLISTVRAIT